MGTALTDARDRSLRLHRAVAAKIVDDGAIVERARARVDTWLRGGNVHIEYARAWHDLLARDAEELVSRLVEDSERMHDLRQVSPFAGALDARTRWRILREGRP